MATDALFMFARDTRTEPPPDSTKPEIETVNMLGPSSKDEREHFTNIPTVAPGHDTLTDFATHEPTVPGFQVAEPVKTVWGSTVPKVFQVPGVPATVQTQPIVPPAVGAVL